ncbi:MAG: HDIG domain-containing protein [Geobacteraceae bacterium]|nr:HDIG domain-containing protein [Geobacteraceae bacterium]
MPSDSGDKEKKEKEKDIRGTLPVLLMRFLDRLTERFSSVKDEKRNRFILILLTAFFLTFLIIPSQQFIPPGYKAGDIATSDIRATQDYLLEDLPLTEKKRAEAEAAAPFVYNYNANAPLEITRRFEKALSLIREARSGMATVDREALPEAASTVLGVTLTDAELRALNRVKSDRALLTDIGRLAGRLYEKKIVADSKAFAADLSHGILVVNPETKQEIAAGDYQSHIDEADARNSLAGARLVLGGEPRDLEAIKGVLARMVKANLTFDRDATDRKQREARGAVRPVLFKLKRGEMVVRVGERITEEQTLKLEKMFAARHGINSLFVGAGVFGLVLILFYFPYRFARKNIRKFNPSNKDLLLVCLLTLGTFLILKISFVVSSAMGGPFPYIDTAAYYYLFPFAVGSILVRIILNSEVALVHAAICAPLFGIMFNNSLPVVIYALLGGIVGAHGVRQCTVRGTIFTAGMKLSVVNLAMAISFQIFSDRLFTMETVYCALFALIGGLVNAVIVTGTIPVIETLFHYTTDIKLLEMANLNSPLLRELMVRAPGTYHHSVLVGNLVEAAAEAINANPLLARVAAYYHDVGKISKPLYFIENVSGGDNRHDRLSPSMSALILTSHVKEGVELAREHRLGLPIIDIIRQSHGTALITFFYQKARDLAVAEGKLVDERGFRYPGPKPQTREAGLVLLADCVEAASRTLTDPTPARIQGMVQKIINSIFIDGQLDECELTLKNLHEIAKSFNRILAGIYHHRIDYPEPAYKEKWSGGRKPLEHSDNEPAKTPADHDEKPKKSGGEDLRRLGILR